MNYLQELQELVALHARAQNMDMGRCRKILARINSVDKLGAGGWGSEWQREGDSDVAAGKFESAFQYYNLARFPYPVNEDMYASHEKCVTTFMSWATKKGLDLKRLSIRIDSVDIPFYFSSAGKNKPLLLVMGGIVSIKEQWQAFLWAAKKLGVSVLVAEMPGVGENKLVYDRSAYDFISELIDAVQDEADVSHTHIVAMSFSGNLALRQAMDDSRIRAITTVGAPVHQFFTDAQWWQQVPLTTKRTLAHLCKVDESEVFAYISRFAIEGEELAALKIPVYYVRSVNDEIIPPGEKAMLVNNLASLSLREYQDVHGSPNHMSDLQKYVPFTVLKEAGTNKVAQTMLNVLLALGGMKRAVGV
ncbi:alpha/beta fold hydrolase [Teredinibacter turnerae]|uniref:alpha/beta fold hydrolase n=1 Tax=Teredinibacter turnerae TaxID=2426 RepID=UPI0003667E3A|nr:alpha/beta fold hydrolase [Teredinibacter turnerae]